MSGPTDAAAEAAEDAPSVEVGGEPASGFATSETEEISNEAKGAWITRLVGLVEELAGLWGAAQEKPEEYDLSTVSGRLAVALAGGMRAGPQIRTLQKELRLAFEEGVEVDAIEERVLDLLHARLLEAAGQPLGGTCPGVTAKGLGCSKMCLRRDGRSVGSCGLHRSQRPYHFSVGLTPFVSLLNCGVCGLGVGASEVSFPCVMSGERYHHSCLDARLSAMGGDLEHCDPTVQLLVVSEVAMARKLIFQLLLNRHLIYGLVKAPETLKLVVLPSRSLPSGVALEPVSLGHALKFVRAQGVEVFASAEPGTELMSPGQRVVHSVKRSRRLAAKKSEDAEEVLAAQAGVASLSLVAVKEGPGTVLQAPSPVPTALLGDGVVAPSAHPLAPVGETAEGDETAKKLDGLSPPPKGGDVPAGVVDELNTPAPVLSAPATLERPVAGDAGVPPPSGEAPGALKAAPPVKEGKSGKKGRKTAKDGKGGKGEKGAAGPPADGSSSDSSSSDEDSGSESSEDSDGDSSDSSDGEKPRRRSGRSSKSAKKSGGGGRKSASSRGRKGKKRKSKKRKGKSRGKDSSDDDSDSPGGLGLSGSDDDDSSDDGDDDSDDGDDSSSSGSESSDEDSSEEDVPPRSKRRGGSGKGAGKRRVKDKVLRRLMARVEKLDDAQLTRQGELPALKGGKGGDSLHDLTGGMDGVSKSNPIHLMHPRAACTDNYLGCDDSKAGKARVKRILVTVERVDMEKDAIGGLTGTESYLSVAGGVTLKLGSEQKHLASQALVEIYLRGRVLELNAVCEAKKSRLRRSHPDWLYHRRKVRLMCARYQFLEAVIHHYRQKGVAWETVWVYMHLFVKECFRVYGYGKNLSPLDRDLLTEFQGTEVQMASTTRPRMLVRAHHDEELMTAAVQRGKVLLGKSGTPQAHPKAAPAKSATPPAGGGGGGGGKGGAGAAKEDEKADKKAERLPDNAKWREICQVVGETQRSPDAVKDGGVHKWKAFKERLETEYEKIKGKRWSP